MKQSPELPQPREQASSVSSQEERRRVEHMRDHLANERTLPPCISRSSIRRRFGSIRTFNQAARLSRETAPSTVLVMIYPSKVFQLSRLLQLSLNCWTKEKRASVRHLGSLTSLS